MGRHCSRTRSILLLMLMMFFNFSRSNYLGEAARVPLLKKLQQSANQGDQENEAAISSSMIGSMPPRCEGRCYSCGHCEAVQVPVVLPQSRNITSDDVVTSWRDDDSNYKPMSWKCKCGDTLLNP